MKYFADAAKARVKITRAQEKAISEMYRTLADDIAREIESLRQKTNVSSLIRSDYLSNLSKQVNEELRRIGENQDSSIKASIEAVSQAVVDNNAKFLTGIGIEVTGSYSYIPTNVLKELVTGQLYKDKNWTLSRAIWKNVSNNQQKINNIIAQGIAAQKSTLEIAQDIEKYVKSTASKASRTIITPKYTIDKNGKKVPLLDKNGKRVVSKFYFGRVDYNAQRLARTMISHAYQQALVESTRYNPFVECYQWLTSNSDRVCDICIERSDEFHGVIIDGQEMPGCYYADDLPLDHPNGMCTVDVIITDSYEDIADRLADWVEGEDDEELDDFAESLGYEVSTFKGKVRGRS